MLSATEVITGDTIINKPYSLCLVSKHRFIFISSRVLKSNTLVTEQILSGERLVEERESVHVRKTGNDFKRDDL